MLLSMFALSLQLAAAPPAVEDVNGAKVSLEDTALLIVAPADRGSLKEKLAVVRERRAASGKKAPTKSMVVIVDLSDVSGLFHGMAKGKLKKSAAEAAKRQPPGAPAPTFVADLDGSLSKKLKGPLKGSCFVRTDKQGAYLRGTTVDELVKRAEAQKP